jgi:LDH2 family malate/lactate/ureidoglycolate dehydrogenase
MSFGVFVVDILVAMLAGAMYSLAVQSARQSNNGLCKLVCANNPKIKRVVPCFVLEKMATPLVG